MNLFKTTILAEKLPDQAETKSGIITHKMSHIKNRVKILDVGPEVKHAKVGETVRLFQGVGNEDTIDGMPVVFFKEHEIDVWE